GDARLALAAALEREVDSHGEFRWTSVVDFVESGTERIEMIGADARDRVRTQPGRDHLRVSNGETASSSQEREVVLDGFVNRRRDGQRLSRGRRGTHAGRENVRKHT